MCSYVAEELGSQPETWRRAADAATGGRASAALPEAGSRVAVVGCGTSLYMAQAYASLRESLGHGVTDAFAASQFPSSRSYDHVLALTRSGTTTEVIRVLKSLPPGARSTVITTSASHPAAALAGECVELAFADEQSVVQTRFATTALALLRAHLGGDLHSAIREAEDALALDLPAELLAAGQFTFLGDGWSVGLAHEAALKLRESAQLWAESYPAMEYRHGPISVADDRSVVWFFSPEPDGLAAEIAATGAVLVPASGDPMAQLVLAQRVAVAHAKRKGLDPDRPRHLTRSIILSAAA